MTSETNIEKPTKRQITLDESMLQCIYRAWERDLRAGKLLTNAAVKKLPPGAAADASAAAFLRYYDAENEEL
jgi:hypothetical protein